MKKIFAIFLGMVVSSLQFYTVFANNSHQLTEKEILVSEIPLGVSNDSCKCAKIENEKNGNEETGKRNLFILSGEEANKTCWDVKTRLYVCEVPTLNAMIQGVVRWIIQISLLLGVLATAILGIAWTMAGWDNPEYKKKLKDWLVGLIIGLIILYGFQYILGIFGWIYTANV